MTGLKLVDCFVLQVDPSVSALPAFGGALGNMLEGMRLMGLTKAGRTEITPGSELYFAFSGGNLARVYFSWNSLGYLGGLALMTARLISHTWSRVKVTKLCIPEEEGKLHSEMTTLSAYLAQRYVAGGSGRHSPEGGDDREDEDEAAARFFQEG